MARRKGNSRLRRNVQGMGGRMDLPGGRHTPREENIPSSTPSRSRSDEEKERLLDASRQSAPIHGNK